MTKNRRWLIAMLGALLALGIAACDGGDSGSVSTAAADTGQTSVATESGGDSESVSTDAADTGQASDPVESTVTFDGVDCVYAGATTFDVNTLPELTVVNESQDAFAFALYQLDDPSLTLEDVLALDTDLLWARTVDEGTQMPDGIRLRSGSGTIKAGASRTINMPLTGSVDHLLGCLTLPLEVADHHVFLADAVITVR